MSAMNVIASGDPQIGVIVFAAASILKDSVNRIGDLLDDGKPNQTSDADGATGSPGRSDGAWAQMGTALNPHAGGVDSSMAHHPLRETTLPIAMGPVNRSPK
jgi:hypothetical protein